MRESSMPDTETRLYNLERDNADIRDRLGKVEDKASSAWKTINEMKEDVSDIYDKIDDLARDVQTIKSVQDSMEIDVKEIKVKQDGMLQSIKLLRNCMIIVGAVIMITTLVLLKSGSDVPEKVVEDVIPVITTVLYITLARSYIWTLSRHFSLTMAIHSL